MGPKEKKGKKKNFYDKRFRSQNKTKTEAIQKDEPEEEKTSSNRNHKLAKNRKYSNKKDNKISSYTQKLKLYFKKYFNQQVFSDLIFNPHYLSLAACAFIILEAVINVLIIEKVKCKLYINIVLKPFLFR